MRSRKPNPIGLKRLLGLFNVNTRAAFPGPHQSQRQIEGYLLEGRRSQDALVGHIAMLIGPGERTRPIGESARGFCRRARGRPTHASRSRCRSSGVRCSKRSRNTSRSYRCESWVRTSMTSPWITSRFRSRAPSTYSSTISQPRAVIPGSRCPPQEVSIAETALEYPRPGPHPRARQLLRTEGILVPAAALARRLAATASPPEIVSIKVARGASREDLRDRRRRGWCR